MFVNLKCVPLSSRSSAAKDWGRNNSLAFHLIHPLFPQVTGAWGSCRVCGQHNRGISPASLTAKYFKTISVKIPCHNLKTVLFRATKAASFSVEGFVSHLLKAFVNYLQRCLQTQQEANTGKMPRDTLRGKNRLACVNNFQVVVKKKKKGLLLKWSVCGSFNRIWIELFVALNAQK